MKNTRVSLIGPGDTKFHFLKLLGFEQRQFQSELEKIAQSLVGAGVEIELLPDDGVCLEIAKLYKANKGKRVVGVAPLSDKTFGVKHLEPYMQTESAGKKVFDEIIDSGDWFKHDLTKALFGDVCLCLGLSPGTEGERQYGIYLYKLISGFKDGVEISGKRIHPEIRAGKNYTIFVYSPFYKSGKLSEEDEAYTKKFGINLVYIKNPKELRYQLLKL